MCSEKRGKVNMDDSQQIKQDSNGLKEEESRKLKNTALGR
jgi:hypothetical protein